MEADIGPRRGSSITLSQTTELTRVKARIKALAEKTVSTHWGPPSAGTVIQTTGGIGSPAQNGNGNTVINNGAPAR